MKKLVTHNGNFHADDVVACAILELVLDARGEVYDITRTRDPKLIADADIVFDVGGEYDAEHMRFDHHQVGGAGKNNAEIPYASSGLVWKEFGVELCGADAVASMIEGEVIMPIDAVDNGIDISKPLQGDLFPYSFQSINNAFRPTWKETDITDDEQFLKMVGFAKVFLERHIIHAQHTYEAAEEVARIYKDAPDKQVIVFENGFSRSEILPVLMQHKEPLFFIYPKTEHGWKLEVVRKESGSFEARKDLPAEWAGKRGVDLQAVTGVEDAQFAHNGRFLAVARSKEGIMKLAKLALSQN